MTTTTNSTIGDAVTAALREGLRNIKNRGSIINEDITKHSLIWPVLTALGYTTDYRIPEYGNHGNRPDDLCYLEPICANPGHAAIIIEAKEYGTDFDKRPPGRTRSESPDRQIQRYVKNHSASGLNTIGLLTDGIKWRIYHRNGSASQPDARFIIDYDFIVLANPEQPALPEIEHLIREQLAEFVGRLSRENLTYGASYQPALTQLKNHADRLFNTLADNPQPDVVLQYLLGEQQPVIQSNLTVDTTLSGIRKDAHNEDWKDYAYAKAVNLRSNTPTLFDQPGVLAVVQHRYDPEEELNRPEVALCARAFASASIPNTSVTLVYTVAPDGDIEARLAIAAGSQVNMTAPFNPALPTPSARAAIDRLLRLLGQTQNELTTTRLLEPLEVAPLRQQFYKDIVQWTGRLQKDKDLSQRQAVLRHLVRVMFAWILKEENIIPPELFEAAFIDAHLSNVDTYHRDILRFLFHQCLNIPPEQRDEHPTRAINDAMGPVPFLNGSLFAEHQDDDDLNIPANQYWTTEENAPGLFTILSRYHWTMDEHRPGESEQTLDPELLSNLFERLIAPTEEGTEPPLRQPKGTYYTPADVADEMVKDALTAAVKDHAPRKVTEAQLLDLFGNPDTPPPTMTPAQRRKLARHVKELRIFDPAVGSGEFLFRALLALQCALGKLEPDMDNPATDIIRRQLSGQDIHPLAVQITRLRLFVAITAARRRTPSNEPLPNLEARIVCADTLETHASPDWRPDATGHFATADPELVMALTAVAENRASWFNAHTEQEKQALLSQDVTLRDRLSQLLQQKGELTSPELIGFAESPLFNLSPRPARTDARLLFYENPWRGFDVVIGNPPYEALSESVDITGRKRLVSQKSYRTTNVGDLYTLFCEAALVLANPEGGVITMIVPLSLSFGRQQSSLRAAFESRCSEINLRQYNNNPSMMFHTTPTTKDPHAAIALGRAFSFSRHSRAGGNLYNLAMGKLP